MKTSAQVPNHAATAAANHTATTAPIAPTKTVMTNVAIATKTIAADIMNAAHGIHHGSHIIEAKTKKYILMGSLTGQ